MKTLNCYVTKSYLVTLLLAIGILTFGMCGARLVEVFELIAQGLPLSVFFKFLWYVFPIVLCFTSPWAALVAVMLVFGRLSADSEITAMRACGVSILQIISPILIITVLLSIFCLYLQLEVAPPYLGKSRDLVKTTAIDNPLALFKAGQPIQTDNMIIYIDDKLSENEVSNIQIYIVGDKKKGAPPTDLSASRARLEVDKEKEVLTLRLIDCFLIDKSGEQEMHMAYDELALDIDYGEQRNQLQLLPKAKYMSLMDLLACLRIEKSRNGNKITAMEIELNQRIALALSPIAFLLLGLPLAIRTSRRETSVGLFLSVLLGGFFYFAIILFESLDSYPRIYPQYLLWLPNLVYQIGGAIMIWRITQR